MTTLQSFCAKEYKSLRDKQEYNKYLPQSWMTKPFLSKDGQYLIATDSFIMAMEYNRNKEVLDSPIDTAYFEDMIHTQEFSYDYSCEKKQLRKILKNCKSHLCLTLSNDDIGVSTDSVDTPYDLFAKIDKKYLTKAMSFCEGKYVYIKRTNQQSKNTPFIVHSDNKNMQCCIIMPIIN